MVIRPLFLIAMIIIASMSLDYIALGGLGALVAGQSIVVIKSRLDGTRKNPSVDCAISKNVFFLANNVTIIVESKGRLFVEACSNLGFKKNERPIPFEVISTLIFMGGVLLLSTAGMNSKVAYLVGHALQAVLLSFHSNRVLGTRTLNEVTWHVKPPVDRRFERRRDAYVWATEETTKNTKWLVKWQLADSSTVDYVNKQLRKAKGQQHICHRLMVEPKRTAVEVTETIDPTRDDSAASAIELV
jgi:hypothetical protein